MAKILIVDGQRTSRQYLSALLGLSGHVAIEANDGDEALEWMKQNTSDLVITDALLQNMDGYEFVEQLRERSAGAPPIIFYVAEYYEKEALDAAQGVGVRYVIRKGSDPENILSIVDSAINVEITEAPKPQASDFSTLQLKALTVPIDSGATVFVVDDDPHMINLLSVLLTSSNLKVETHATAESFLDGYHDKPGCLVMDLQLPGMGGLAMLSNLRARRMHIPVIIMTAQADLADAKKALKLHVLDFLDKAVSRRTLLTRVYSALQEDSNKRREQTELQTNRDRLALLTARERQLLELLIDGKASKEIAAALKISVKTVAIHRAHLMAKTGAANVADLVRISMIARDV